MEEKGNTVIQPGGLSKDISPVVQPDGSTSFVLNGVNESEEGDSGFLSTENSNKPCYELPVGFIPIGKIYIGNEETLLFLANPNGDSMLVITDKECNLTVIVSDADQTNKFGFKVTQQIDATYRLRRGCERTIYWVDPKPRVFIIEKPEEFQDSAGDWDMTKFNLFKTYASIPDFMLIEVLEGNGSLLPGSYSFTIQYLDADLNPTEFITSTEPVNIYNSSFNLPYRDVRGSTAKKEQWQDFGNTDKAININLANLDTSFPFYRIGITEATSGTGAITDTKYTSEISTQNTSFTYTGTNFEVLGSQKEIVMFNGIIDYAENIEQIENRLILGTVKGKQIDFCKLQKYASRINADMVTKTVVLSELDIANSKHPTAYLDGLGYMPGEIYSFGIVYIFDDNSLSPVYHIPGKNPALNPTTMFSVGSNIYPMNNTDNQSEDNRYIDNDTCGTAGYWGVDATGEQLEGELVRHHRFPLRTDVNIPMVEKASTNTTSTLFKRINVAMDGTIAVPIICYPEGDPFYDPSCTPTIVNPFEVKINYTEDGVPGVFTFIVTPEDWSGVPSPTPITYQELSNLITGTNIVITSIEEEGVTVPGTWGGGAYTSNSASPKGLNYEINATDALNESTEDTYIGHYFGIRFSGIELPDVEELNGNSIIGYYIVRNERTEEDKTVLDSGVLTSTVKNKNFVSSGLLMPQFTTDALIKKDVLTLINPEFKFNDRKYTNFSTILQQGRFTKTEAIYSRTKINDVMDGTGYVAGKHKFGESDRDGWSIQIKTRDNRTAYVNQSNFSIPSTEVKDTFYLDALGDKQVLDSNDEGVDVFNLACDNKVGMLSLDHEVNFPIMNSVPYVYLLRGNANPYSNFRLTPYYKENRNPQYFNNATTVSVDVFNGDSYITPMRYVNSIFYDNRIKQRAGRTNAWSYIAGALLVVAAVAIAIFTAGTGTAASVALLGVAGGLVGGASLLIASGLKQDAWNKAYNNLYKQGLKETIADDYVQFDADPNNGRQRGFKKNPSDDEIQWLGDCLNLWFESAVNINLRHGNTDNTPDFVNAPGKGEVGSSYPEWNREYFGINSVGSTTIEPTTTLDNHMVKKLTFFNYDRKASKEYVGVALAEVYAINPDFNRRNRQKLFNHLGLEYDCCSDCIEDFPNRWHWSEQSFQEELTDNFRTFLPNNYKDLEGNSGKITDIFRIQNNLYFHTAEALWYMPQNIQERITGDIISFIGTGEYFNIPPRKIVDDSNSSSGNIHKWARLKTKFGVLYPSHREKKWYMFNGEKLEPISDMGMSSHFREAMVFSLDEQYYAATNQEYPYSNNPSNPIGTGYISTYDSTKERLIVTKKDSILDNGVLPEGSQICTNGSSITIFNDIAQTIEAQAELGYTFVGIEDCRLKFSKTVYEETVVTQQIQVSIPNTAHIYAFYDTSGSFDGGQLLEIKNSVIAWYADFRPGDPTMTLLHHINDATERWLNFASAIPAGQDVMVLTFVNEANPVYHGSSASGTVSAPTGAYVTDYTNFTTNVFPNLNSFIGINYPIVTSNLGTGTSISFLQHSLAAVKGRNFTLAEVNALEVNSAYTAPQWSTLKSSLLTNSYSGLTDGMGNPGLEQFNWVVKSNKNDLGTPVTADCPASDDIISPCQFAQDINTLLADFTTVEEVDVTISVPVTEYIYIDGEDTDLNRTNNGWTMSYSLKRKNWVSWHNYLPSFYFHVQDKHYSWKDAEPRIWKHNDLHKYGSFYGVQYPFIVEYVDSKNPLMTQITDGIMFQTEAKRFDNVNKEYFDVSNITFNRILAYNSHQITGMLDMIVKNNTTPNYLAQQIINAPNYIPIDRNERNWTVNNLRSIRSNTDVPMFIKAVPLLNALYYIDKVQNPAAINYNMHWSQLESLRDKYLVVRLIFDTFDDTKLIMNFAVQDKKVSER